MLLPTSKYYMNFWQMFVPPEKYSPLAFAEENFQDHNGVVSEFISVTAEVFMALKTVLCGAIVRVLD